MKINFDVDIDFADRSKALEKLDYVSAGIEKDGVIRKHNTGVYFQDIPFNPITRISNVGYKAAEELGYFKVDFLNVSLYEDITTEDELVSLMVEPDWTLLQDESVVSQLFHVREYFWLVDKLKPTSVEQLSMLLAIIRPAKRSLANLSWKEIEKEVWVKPTTGEYYFKRSHSLSYAMAIVVQLNMISRKAV